MFSQAYWHHAVRAQKAMLFRAIQALLVHQIGAKKVRELISDFVEMSSNLPESLYHFQPAQRDLFKENIKLLPVTSGIGRGTDFAATDAAVLAWFHERLAQENLPEKLLIEGILKRRLFKRLWVIGKEMESTKWDRIIKLWPQLKRNQLYKLAHDFEESLNKKLNDAGFKDVTTMKKETAKDQVDRATKGHIPWLIIDIPGARPGSQVPLYYVLEGQRRSLRKDDRSVGDLQESKIWDEYGNNLLSAAGKIRIFCDPDFIDSVEVAIEWRQGIDVLITTIEKLIE
jgi:hypothetical protein